MATALQPDFETFRTGYDQGKTQLVWTRWVADLETPVSAMLKLMQQDSPCFLLESVEGGETRGRYSVIGLMPDLIWRCKGDKAEISRKDTMDEESFKPCKEGSLASLRTLIKDSMIDIPPGLPPMAAGLVGYMTYDVVRLMERLPDKNSDVIGIPDGCFIRPKVMAIFDSVQDVIYIATPIWNKRSGSAEKAYEAAQKRIEAVVKKLNRALSPGKQFHDAPAATLEFSSNTTREGYHAMVHKAKEYIAAGDIFQVVPSQRFSAPFKHSPFAFYRALRHLNPSPFLFYLNFGNFNLIGSSPEILVRLRDEKVTIRPIAGTRKRGITREEDLAMEKDLLADPKEVAEHLMLLDLGRNDVGRIAKIGSVHVTQHMVIERYSHVMHIVSNVEGDINPQYDAIDALVAGFPAGTVSGAPKIRAMEIIDELESERRSFYAGCVGYFSAGGSMDTCITLRTALIKDGTIYVQAGGGVVADSDPEAEFQESLNKAKALMRAAEEAAKFV